MCGSFCHASGIIIMTASWRVRPESSRNSSTLSKLPESEQSGSTTGKASGKSSPKRSLSRTPSRACIQFMLPRNVLISPLWLMNRFGWARSHDGKVFVANREWTIARCDS